MPAMWNWFNCYLSGRHEYGVWCERGAIFLRCAHCGRRSTGWAIDSKLQPTAAAPPSAAAKPAAAAPRVLPFNRVAAG